MNQSELYAKIRAGEAPLLEIAVECDAPETVAGSREEIMVIPFHGEAKGPLFQGKIIGTGMDTQTGRLSREKVLSARYMLAGTDLEGNACRIFVENQGNWTRGFIPKLVTDSALLREWETARLRATVDDREGGVLVRVWGGDAGTDYGSLRGQVRGLLAEEPYYLSALSNLSALLYETLPDLNWAGFYLLREGRLTVGPFQGKPACIHIPIGKGVCGTAIARDEILNVPDVHAFPGHIACDSASESEIVLPIHHADRPVAVLDIDSPVPSRFSAEDEAGLQELVRVMETDLDFGR